MIISLPSPDSSMDEVLDPNTCAFEARACALLREQGFARLLLTASDSQLVPQLLRAATAFFESDAATRGAHIPPRERRAHDSRRGYVRQQGREFLELHPRVADSQVPASVSGSALQGIEHAATAFAECCHALGERVLDELASSSVVLASFLHSERAASSAASAGDGKTVAALPTASPSPLAHGPGRSPFAASMIRVHRYTQDADYPPHADLGLLTIAPRADVPGLLVQHNATGEPCRQCVHVHVRAYAPALSLTRLLLRAHIHGACCQASSSVKMAS